VPSMGTASSVESKAYEQNACNGAWIVPLWCESNPSCLDYCFGGGKGMEAWSITYRHLPSMFLDASV
jgi:hypothetical protein